MPPTPRPATPPNWRAPPRATRARPPYRPGSRPAAGLGSGAAGPGGGLLRPRHPDRAAAPRPADQLGAGSALAGAATTGAGPFAACARPGWAGWGRLPHAGPGGAGAGPSG